VSIIVGDSPEADTEEPAGDNPEVPAMEAPADPPMEMAAFVKSINEHFDALAALIGSKQKAEAETAFRERADAMGLAGVPAAAIEHALEMGAKTNWDQSILDFAAKASGTGLELGSATKSQRKADPSKRNKLTPEDIKAAADAMTARMGTTRKK
jgi:hypothetical protein